MAVYQYGDRIPKIGKNAYISDSARVIGDVVIEENCYIGHGAIIRGDYGTIHIGPGTAVEESAILHIRPDGLLELEDHVTVGHGAIIHGRLILWPLPFPAVWQGPDQLYPGESATPTQPFEG